MRAVVAPPSGASKSDSPLAARKTDLTEVGSGGKLRLSRPREPRSLAVVGLFAGIGGFERGLAQAGHRTQLLCEIMPAARAVLARRFPDVECVPDVAELGALPAQTDLLVGGFPCQDLSQAGKTAGIGGDRSGLVRHVFRLLERQRVPTVALENVPFMLQLGRGRALEFIVAEFERLGYAWAYRVVDARAFGLPQRRRRVLFVASRELDPAGLLLTQDAGVPEPLSATDVACGFYWTEGLRGLGWAVDAVPTLKGGSSIGVPSPPAILLPGGEVVTPDIRDAERMQGFPKNWTKPAEEVVRSGHRWQLVGNAVSVRVARWLGQQLARPTAIVSGSIPGAVHLRRTGSWPRVAWGIGGRHFTAPVSEFPRHGARKPLREFLEEAPKPLSARATAGFLSRTRRAKLRFPEGFIPALEQHLARVSEPG